MKSSHSLLATTTLAAALLVSPAAGAEAASATNCASITTPAPGSVLDRSRPIIVTGELHGCDPAYVGVNIYANEGPTAAERVQPDSQGTFSAELLVSPVVPAGEYYITVYTPGSGILWDDWIPITLR